MVSMRSVFDPQNQKNSTESKIVFAIDRLAEAMKSLLWSKYNKFKLSPIQTRFLIFLYYSSAKRRTVSTLAKEFNLTKATVSDAVASLVKKQLLSRKKEKADQRIVTLTLTAKGTKTAKKLSGFGTELAEALKGISSEKKITVFQTLMDIIEKLHKNGIIPVARMCTTCIKFETGPSKGEYFCTKRGKVISTHDLLLDCDNYEDK